MAEAETRAPAASRQRAVVRVRWAGVDADMRAPPRRGSGAPGTNRTCDPWLRRPILYPLSYGRAELLKNTAFPDGRPVLAARDGNPVFPFSEAFMAHRPGGRGRHDGLLPRFPVLERALTPSDGPLWPGADPDQHGQ